MRLAKLQASEQSNANRPDTARIVHALRFAAPALLFGLRLWTAVCLALYTAFWLQLDNAFWAGTSAAIVCQPGLGASLRKGWLRMVGTAVGAVAIVILTASFPQQRDSFLLGLAFWCAACGLLATLLRNFAAYAAALAGITAAIIASDEFGAVGGANGDVFILAITRASEICIGIICAGVVLAGTDFGGARQRLVAQLATISAEIVERLVGTFSLAGPEQSKTRPVRHDLIRRVTEIDPVIDEALGASSDLRPHSPTLQATVGGLFAALSGWRTVAVHLELSRGDDARREADIVLENIPLELRSLLGQEQAAN
jgi:Fusaric acid resistance protein family